MTIEIQAESGQVLEQPCDALVLPILEGDANDWGGTALAVDTVLSGELRRLADEARFSGAIGTTFVLPTLGRLLARRIILTGIGRSVVADREAVRRGWGAAALATRAAGAATIVSETPPTLPLISTESALVAAAEGVRLALYQFNKYRGATRQGPSTRELTGFRFVDPALDQAAATRALHRAETTAAAVSLARDLGNEPASVLTPAAFAAEAERVGAAAGLTVEVLGPEQLTALGANAIVAVGRGSENEPRLIRLSYRPTERSAGNASGGQRVVGLVGKGITFDTGGYSIKTYEGMLEMKGDMSGAAAVLGTMSALRALDCQVAVEATICAAENMISGTAFRPGDILTALNGVTIEILSTDAEGRLVLADGLVDTARRGATELIDLATLTGAAVVALGEGTSALFASDEALAERLLAAATTAGERSWRLPLIEELNEKIKGTVGDIKNSGGRAGGAITAALFLRRFREGLPWAHFDIAGSSRRAKNGPLGPKGATGVGVLTLLAYLTEGGGEAG